MTRFMILDAPASALNGPFGQNPPCGVISVVCE
jgi:hypothetical protein